MFEKVKSWFKNSLTLFSARVWALVGVVTSVVAAADWSPLLGMSGLDRKQVAFIGAVILAQALNTEIARRRTL